MKELLTNNERCFIRDVSNWLREINFIIFKNSEFSKGKVQFIRYKEGHYYIVGILDYPEILDFENVEKNIYYPINELLAHK